MRVSTLPKAILTLVAVALLVAPASADEQKKAMFTVRLQNGTTLVGAILDETPQSVRMRVEGLGEIEVQASEIVERTEGTIGVIQVPTQGVPTEDAPPPSAGTPAGVKWTRTLMVGGNFQSAQFHQGPVEGSVPGVQGKVLGLPGSQVSGQLRGTIQRTSALNDWWVGANANYMSVQPRGALAKSYEVIDDYRHNLTPKWFLLSLTDYTTDKIRHIDDQLIQIFGVGRRIVNTPRSRFDLVGGIEVERSNDGTKYDGEILEGFGAVESYHLGAENGFGLDQRLLVKTVVQNTNLFSFESYVGVNAPLTKRLALTVGWQSTYDRMLRLTLTKIPANAFYPGSPAASFYASEPWSNQLTTGVQVRF